MFVDKKESLILHILPAQAKQKPKKQKKGTTQSAPVQKLADVIGPQGFLHLIKLYESGPRMGKLVPLGG